LKLIGTSRPQSDPVNVMQVRNWAASVSIGNAYWDTWLDGKKYRHSVTLMVTRRAGRRTE
jgi:hypothetical protein